MPTCLFILQRFYLRVDRVLVRTCDTRIYHEVCMAKDMSSDVGVFLVSQMSGVRMSKLSGTGLNMLQLGWDYMLREYCEREDSFSDIKVC